MNRRLHHSYESYLQALVKSEFKLEYCDGEIYLMPEGTPTHAQLGARAIRTIGVALPTGCEVFSSDLKVRIEASDLSTFPDATVVCGAREVSALDANAVTNPSLLIEVSSAATEDYDRGEKLSHYKQLPSLRAVLLISHRARRVTLVQRITSGWEVLEFRSGEELVVMQPKIQFTVDALYEGVDLALP